MFFHEKPTSASWRTFPLVDMSPASKYQRDNASFPMSNNIVFWSQPITLIYKTVLKIEKQDLVWGICASWYNFRVEYSRANISVHDNFGGRKELLESKTK